MSLTEPRWATRMTNTSPDTSVIQAELPTGDRLFACLAIGPLLALVLAFVLLSHDELSVATRTISVISSTLLCLFVVDRVQRVYRFAPDHVGIRRLGVWTTRVLPERIHILNLDQKGFTLWDHGDGPFHLSVPGEFARRGALFLEVETYYRLSGRLCDEAC